MYLHRSAPFCMRVISWRPVSGRVRLGNEDSLLRCGEWADWPYYWQGEALEKKETWVLLTLNEQVSGMLMAQRGRQVDELKLLFGLVFDCAAAKGRRALKKSGPTRGTQGYSCKAVQASGKSSNHPAAYPAKSRLCRLACRQHN